MNTKSTKTLATVESADSFSDVSSEDVAARAYEIYLSGAGGDNLANWLQAERELHGMANTSAPEPEGERTADAVT